MHDRTEAQQTTRLIPWLHFPSEERLAAYRAAGVRYEVRGDLVLIELRDEDKAMRVDSIEGDQ